MIHDRIFHGKKESWKVTERKTAHQKISLKKSRPAKMSSLPGIGD